MLSMLTTSAVGGEELWASLSAAVVCEVVCQLEEAMMRLLALTLLQG